MRRIITTLALLGAVSLSGVAAADDHHRGHVGHDRHGYYQRGGHAYFGYNRGYYAPRYGYRSGYYNYGYRPYYGHRYFNYYHRPALIVESYWPRPGFVWVNGWWYWGGVEWVWQPGYYRAIGYAY